MVAGGEVLKDRKVRKSVVESAAETADDDEGLCAALDSDLDRRLRVGNILFGLEANDLGVLGDIALGEGIKIADGDIDMVAEQLCVKYARIGGDGNVLALRVFGYEVGVDLTADVDKGFPDLFSQRGFALRVRYIER